MQIGAKVTVEGRRGLVLLACGDVFVNGLIDASAGSRQGGAGGFEGGEGSTSSSGGFTPARKGDSFGAGGGGGGAHEAVDPWRESGGGGGGLGEPGGSGLFMWTRGDEVRFEEPPLCAHCATAVGVTAFSLWAGNDEDE